MASESVLVTGGAGYIGSHVCKALAQAGFQPVVLDNLSTGHRWAVRWGPLVEASIDDPQALAQILRGHKPVGAIHLAAKAYVPESVEKPDLYFDNNVRQLVAFLDLLRPSDLRAVVFSSSCSVYGTPARTPVDEDLPLQPISPYAQTKLFGEWALQAYAAAYGFGYALLRYFNAAGADPEREIGEVHDPETHLIPNALQAAAQGRPLAVFGDDYPTPDGTCIRDYVHVSDLADAHVRALQKVREGHNLILNLGTGTGNSVLEVAQAVRNVTGKPLEIDLRPRRPGDVEALFASRDKAKQTLGWEPRFTQIEPIVQTAWEWAQAVPPRGS